MEKRWEKSGTPTVRENFGPPSTEGAIIEGLDDLAWFSIVQPFFQLGHLRYAASHVSHLLSRLPPNKLRYHDASEPRHAQGEFCRSCVCSALQVVTGLKHVAQNAFPDCREPLNQILTCVRTSWNLANERFFGSGLQMRNDVLMFTGGTCSHHQPIDLRQIQTCHEKSEKSAPET